MKETQILKLRSPETGDYVNKLPEILEYNNNILDNVGGVLARKQIGTQTQIGTDYQITGDYNCIDVLCKIYISNVNTTSYIHTNGIIEELNGAVQNSTIVNRINNDMYYTTIQIKIEKLALGANVRIQSQKTEKVDNLGNVTDITSATEFEIVSISLENKSIVNL